MSLLEKFLRKKGKKGIVLYIIFCVNLSIYFTLIQTLEPYWYEINSEVSGWVGFDFDIVLLVRILLVFPLIYGLSIFLYSLFKIS